MNPKSGEAIFEKLLAREIVILLGAHNISQKYERERLSLSPRSIIIHEDWNPHILRYDADIAMLTFDREIATSDFIQPICLWNSPTSPSAQLGTVVGWGQSEDKSKHYEPIPSQLKVPIHRNVDCFLENSNLAKISSRRTFCAGSSNGSGVCLGDSGHGLFIRHDQAFYLKGIVSSSQVDDGSCDVNHNAVYTNVIMFSEWIKKILNVDIDLLDDEDGTENSFANTTVEYSDEIDKTVSETSFKVFTENEGMNKSVKVLISQLSTENFAEPTTRHHPEVKAPALDDVSEDELRSVATEGSFATLRCFATGFPPPSITWKRFGIEVELIYLGSSDFS